MEPTTCQTSIFFLLTKYLNLKDNFSNKLTNISVCKYLQNSLVFWEYFKSKAESQSISGGIDS